MHSTICTFIVCNSVYLVNQGHIKLTQTVQLKTF